MSSKTAFAGITRLEPGESLAEDNFAFQGVDRTIIDKLLRVGAQSHHHDAHPALANPTASPTVAVVASGGAIASDLSITVGYTLTDADGGETALNASAVVVSTPSGMVAPETAPALTRAYASGSLLAGNYAYSVTVTDGVGGETTIGSSSEIALQPGYASGRVTITGLSAIATQSGGSGWRLWRSVNGGTLALIATGASDIVVDDGSLCPDTSVAPPTRTGSTRATSKLQVTVPAQSSAAVSFSIYATLDGSFQSPALLGRYPIASAGVRQEFTSLAPLAAAPPIVSRALAGANKINPDTDMVAFPWKRPAATFTALPTTGNVLGDVRLAQDTRRLYYWGSAAVWEPFAPGPAGPAGASGAAGPAGASGATGPAGAGAAVNVTDANGPLIPNVTLITFVASGGAIVDATDQSGGSALVTISASAVAGPAGPQGPAGPTGSAVAAITDADGPVIPNIGHFTFVGSGGTGVRTIDNTGGSATVEISGGGGGGVTALLLDEPFSSNNLTKYTAHEGSSLTGLVVSDGTLGSSDANNHEFHDAAVSLVDGKHVIKVIPRASTGWIANIKKWVNANNFLLIQAHAADANVYLYTNVAGTYTAYNLGAHGMAANGTPRWLVLRHVGDNVTGELWRTDPALGGAPALAYHLALAGTAATAVGAGVAGHPGMRFAGYTTAGFTTTDWRADDWKTVSLAAADRAAF